MEESTFHEGQLVQRFCSRMSFLSPTSTKDIHWNSSFLKPPIDSSLLRKGRRSLLRLLSKSIPSLNYRNNSITIGIIIIIIIIIIITMKKGCE